MTTVIFCQVDYFEFALLSGPRRGSAERFKILQTLVGTQEYSF